MASTPIFIITSIGLQVASQATPTGPFINIAGFKVGTAFGYTVTPDDLDLTGEVLFEGTVSSYSYLGDNIIKLVCKLPPEAGPFEFGEVGLYLDDGTLFAKAAFDTLQSKYSSLGTNLSLTYSFNCLLQLAQSVSVFNISGAQLSTPVLSIQNWSDIVPPELSAYDETSLLILNELDRVGDATLLLKASPTKWSIASNYYPIGSFLVKDATSTWVELEASQWPYLDSANLEVDVEQLSLVLETSSGYFRSIASVQHIGAAPVTAVRFLLNPTPLSVIPGVGSTVTIHADQLSSLVVPVIDGVTFSSRATNLGGGAAGHLVYQAAPDVTAFLVPGAAGTVLRSAGLGAPPTWVLQNTLVAGHISGGTAGQVLYQAGAGNTGKVPVGADGQVLTLVNGTPVWNVPAVSAGVQQPGEICFFARSTAPTGFLKANGAVLLRTDYSALFAAIGTVFNTGGETALQFRLPDVRGLFPRYLDDGKGIDVDRIAALLGLGSTQLDQLKSHTHALGGSMQFYGQPSISTVLTAISSSNTGATGGTETRPRNIALLGCIKF